MSPDKCYLCLPAEHPGTDPELAANLKMFSFSRGLTPNLEMFSFRRGLTPNLETGRFPSF